MKKITFAFLPMMAVAVMACAQGRKTSTGTTAGDGKQTAASTKPPQITSVTMHRGACFGRCPVYSIKVEDNGALTYTGERNTELEGVFSKKANASAAKNLLAEFMKYRVDTCVSEYPVTIADVPGIWYEVVAGGKQIFINHANFGPQFLGQLAVKVDELGTSTPGEWTKTAELPR